MSGTDPDYLSDMLGEPKRRRRKGPRSLSPWDEAHTPLGPVRHRPTSTVGQHHNGAPGIVDPGEVGDLLASQPATAASVVDDTVVAGTDGRSATRAASTRAALAALVLLALCAGVALLYPAAFAAAPLAPLLYVVLVALADRRSA